MKRIASCKTDELSKFDNFWTGVKLEKRQLATLPPLPEIDPTLHSELIDMMDTRLTAEYRYLHEILPDKLNEIKLNWYENRSRSQQVIFVAETESDASVCSNK